MPKLFTEEAKFDPAARATDVLDAVLEDTSEAAEEKKKNEADVEEELRRERILQAESQRVRSRVLFITKDAQTLEKDSPAQDYYKNLEEVFDEVHVIVMGIRRKELPTQRISSKVWAYPIHAKSFLRQPFAAYALAKKELCFTDGFRPDIVITKDVFESGIAGYFIAKHFKRALQVHISEDFYTQSFKEEDAHNGWRLQFANFVLKRTLSVRVQTDTLKKKIKQHYQNIEDLALLPRYFNIQETLARSERAPKEKLYPQFAFTVLFIGTLDTDSTLFRAIDAVRPILRTPSIGMVVIGDGPSKEEFKTRTKILGIDTQVLFKPKVEDILLHMQSSDVLIQTDTDSESENIVVTAAASGLPIIASHTTLRDDLFSDGDDAFLCDPTDTLEFSQKLVKFLNTNTLRIQFAQNAKDIVQSRIEEDPAMYRLALRDSIEEALYQAEEKKQQTLENVQKAIEEEKQQNDQKHAKQEEKIQHKKAKAKKTLQKKISKGGVEMKLPTQ
jgi:glycosyltransferase involved in cell wall biosynthesis